MGTLKVSKILNANTTDGGIEIDSTGHVQVDGVQMPTAGPLSNRNLIINGDMRIAQRGTSTTSSGYGSVDRWQFRRDNTSGATFSQETLTSGDPYDEGFRHFARGEVTSANAANDRWCQFEQGIEAQNVAGSGWNYTNTNSSITVTFWVRSSLAGTYYLVLRDTDTSHFTYPSSFALTANTWTKVTKTIPGNSNLVFNNDTGIGLHVLVKPDYGSDFTGSQATNNAWYDRTGDDWVPDYSQNWLGTANNTFDITGVQLEVGDKATPFEHRSFGDELAKCQRYYVEDGGSNFHQLFGAHGFNINTTTCNLKTYLPVPMRTSATLSFTGTPRLDNGAAGFNCTNLTGAHPHPNLNYYSMTATSSGLTQHQPVSIDAGSNAAVVKIDAEL